MTPAMTKEPIPVERIDEMRAVADALDEFAMIDEAEGGNPLVISTERRASDLLRAASLELKEHRAQGGVVKGLEWEEARNAFYDWWVGSGRRDDYDVLAEQAACAAWNELASRSQALSDLVPVAAEPVEFSAEEAPFIMRLVAAANAMVGWADLSTPQAQSEWLKWRDISVEALRLSSSVIAHPSRSSTPVVSDEMVERLARFITEECFGYSWEGLQDEGRRTDSGYRVFIYNSFGGMALQGTKNDMRDVARNALAALSQSIEEGK